MNDSLRTTTGPEYDVDLFRDALQVWCPGARAKVVRSLRGGYSGAAVLLTDIDRGKPNSQLEPGALLSGSYVLKLDYNRPHEGTDQDEAQRHKDACAWAPLYAADHFPPLRQTFRQDARVAMLYEVAGGSLVRLIRSDELTLTPLVPRVRQFSESMLLQFNAKQAIAHDFTVAQLMQNWLGDRLDPTLGASLYALAASITGDRRAFVRFSHILANPLEITRGAVGGALLPAVFTGMVHGDLHGGNLFWDRPPTSDRFWLLDFAFSRMAPLLFDHAYFEFSLMIDHLKGADPSRLLSLLDCLQYSPEEIGGRFISPHDEGLRTIVASLRSGIAAWQQREQHLRADPVEEQLLLARIAAGLNWANKPLDPSLQRLAFYYSAHAAKQYLERFHPHLWQDWGRDVEPVDSRGSLAAPIQPPDQEWCRLWTEMGVFAPTDYYVLLVGILEESDALSTIGLLPWSAVLDFDPDSDVHGLLKCARSNLEKERGLHFCGREMPPINFTRGTAWVMASGSTTLNEPVPKSVSAWRPLYKQVVRRIASEMRAQSAPSIIRVLVLPGKKSDHAWLKRALEEFVDELGTERRVVVSVEEGDAGHWVAPEVNQIVTLPSENFARHLQSILGATHTSDLAMVPGVRAPVELDIQKLRNFEEDFQILHSAVLSGATYDDDQAFWRGAPPTWRDLETQAPVARDVSMSLVPAIRAKLKANVSDKVELFHTPGAGGTTVALAAAWEIRREYPTAVLRTRSRNTADRVSWLFHLSGLPVLLIADASVLSITELDELRRRVSHENARVVVLYVMRVTAHTEHEFRVYDPMDKREAEKFATAFTLRTTDSAKIRLLGEIGCAERAELAPLRSPFFFGLVTFEAAFTHIGDYVHHHVDEASYPEKKLLQYLSLVAAHSQAYLSASLARSLLNLSSNDQRPLSEIMSAGSGRLVLEWDNIVKLVHPIIGEEILRQLGGGENKWKFGLTDLCIDFAGHVLQAAGGYTKEARLLFKNLFIDREEWGVEDASGRRDKFSPLVERLPNDAARGRLLESLTNLCPEESHLWNHRGRHCVYSETPNYPEAEICLQKAIELSNGLDPLHHHALGQVRRLWLRNIVRDLRASRSLSNEPLTSQALFDCIKTHATGALSAFAVSRELAPEDEHGYITAIQTILYIVEELSKGSVHGFAEVSNLPGQVGDWVREAISTAELMLVQLSRIRGNTKESSYEINCLAKLARLYGDFTLIAKWEKQLTDSAEPQSMRRAIASLYLAQKKREWSRLEPKALRRIVKMSEDNLRTTPSDERDLRFWFQAMRRLPEFNYLEATERLQAWGSAGNALDAFYYLYILTYLQWKHGGLDAEDVIQSYIERCISKRIGERGFSHEWLAVEPEYCPIISHRDVGEWDPQVHFFKDTTRLAMVKGTIESIKPQAGYVRLGRVLRAFFRPPPTIRESSHLNAVVYFYLGFSFDGFRAWGVQLEAPREKEKLINVSHSNPVIASPVKLWVGGIPSLCNEFELRTLFEPFGRVERVDIPKGDSGEHSRGFAFVVMQSKSDAEKAIRSLDGKQMPRGRRLSVRESDDRR